ncbi:hypothetical protein ACF0H5_018147 [Mactra antiquata]
MTTRHPELSDDEHILDLLRLVVTRHPSAMSAIEEAFKHSPHLASCYLTFNFRENGSRTDHECRCHYEHEYMTYIKETGFDFDSFSHMAKNVIRGYCRHSVESPTSASPSPIYQRSMVLPSSSCGNVRRYSVDFDLTNNNKLMSSRLTSRRSSSSLKSLESNDFNKRMSLSSRRSSSSLRSLTLDIEEIVGQTQTSLIHAAAAVGDGALLLFLLKKARVSLEQLGKFQLSPLHLAIIKHRMCYLKNFILRPEIYLTNRAGIFRYAQILADSHGHKYLDVIKISLIGLCVRTKEFDTMQDLLNSGVMSDVALQRGLKEAIEEDSLYAVELLFKNGVRPDLQIMKVAAGRSLPVFESVFRRFRKDFKIYSLQHPEHITRELLMPAILTRNYWVVKVLVENGAHVACKGFYTPLTLAVLENQPDVTKLLLEHHADKSPELQGCNLLDIATCMGYIECAEVLRRFGMKRKSKRMKHTIPCNLLLGIAKKLDLTQDLVKLRRHLEIKSGNQYEDTVLHVALATKVSRRLISELLRMGSNVNARNKKLETPLMRAIATEAEMDVIRELLYYNPVLEQCDKYGKTTLAMAMSRDHIERSNTARNLGTEKVDSIATLLLDCGYNVKYDDLKKPHHTVYALRAVWKDLAATIGCGRDGMYVHQNPKGLQMRCREVVRRSQPGIRLHKYLEHMKVPPDIKDFVLMADLLKDA